MDDIGPNIKFIRHFPMIELGQTQFCRIELGQIQILRS